MPLSPSSSLNPSKLLLTNESSSSSSCEPSLTHKQQQEHKIIRTKLLLHMFFTLSFISILVGVWEMQNRLFKTFKEAKDKININNNIEEMIIMNNGKKRNINHSLSSSSATTLQEDCIPIRPHSWEKNYYYDNHRKNHTQSNYYHPRKRLLIGLYAGYDKYAKLLEITAPINKAYAKLWGHDVIVLQGTVLLLPNEKQQNCTPNGRRVTFNKIALLHYALQNNHIYDQLLLLDTDAMMYNFSYDVTTLLQQQHDDDNDDIDIDTNNYMLAAHRVHGNDIQHTWDINAGVTLWNLHHKQTLIVAKNWYDYSYKVLQYENPNKGDQSQLHKSITKTKSEIYILSNRNEFAYENGTIIRHYIRRGKHMGWYDPYILDNRLNTLQEQANEVCYNNNNNTLIQNICNTIEHVRYT